MKVWIETRLVEPPDFTVSGQSGGSIMFVGYWRALNEWRLLANGTEELIAEPEMIFLEEHYIKTHMLKTPRGRREKPSRIRRSKRGEQLSFEL